MIYSEIEAKFDAREVSEVAFMRYAMERGPTSYRLVTGPDVYYEQGPNVLRHRLRSGTEGLGEITVKKRRANDSIMDRLEINLRFEKNTSPNEVEAFLQATGWTKAFTLMKSAQIFNYDYGPVHVSVVRYEVGQVLDTGEVVKFRHFIEVEVEGTSKLTEREKSLHLLSWCANLRGALGLSEPLNQSLYEIYSGKRYQMESP